MEAGLETYVRQPSIDHAHPSQHLIKAPKKRELTAHVQSIA